MLAALPPAQVRALYPKHADFTQRTGSGPITPQQLRQLLRQVARDGWAAEDGEVTEHMCSVGVAVLDHNGWPIAALAVTWPEHLGHDPSELAEQVGQRARQLTARLG